MATEMVEQVVHQLALELSYDADCRVLIETDRQKLLGSDVVELRIFLKNAPCQITADQWVGMYQNCLEPILDEAGLKLASDEWFTPSQRFPSCGCWIVCPAANQN